MKNSNGIYQTGQIVMASRTLWDKGVFKIILVKYELLKIIGVKNDMYSFQKIDSLLNENTYIVHEEYLAER